MLQIGFACVGSHLILWIFAHLCKYRHSYRSAYNYAYIFIPTLSNITPVIHTSDYVGLRRHESKIFTLTTLMPSDYSVFLLYFICAFVGPIIWVPSSTVIFFSFGFFDTSNTLMLAFSIHICSKFGLFETSSFSRGPS